MRRRRVGVRALQRCIRDWRARLLLHDWTIHVNLEPCDDEANTCEIEVRPEYREADLTVDLDRLTPDDLDSYVHHEMLHLLTWALWSVAHDAARSDAGRELARRDHEALVTALERITGQIPAA